MPPPRSRRVVVVARALLLAIPLAGVVAAWRLGRAPGPDSLARGLRFVCAMHPDVTAQEPGRCPICGMALEPLAATPPSQVATSRYLDLVRQRTFAQDLITAGWLDDEGTVSAIVYKD